MTITVKISGRPVRKGGFIPILNLHDADFIIADNYPMSISGDEFYYTVEASERMTVYKLVYNRITTPGEAYPGTMVIGVGIPRGWRVEAGVDQLLRELLDTFIANYSWQSDEGLQVYNIKGLDPDVFRQILDKYPLVEGYDDRLLMNRNGGRVSVTCDAGTMPAVLAAVTHSDIFAPYSEVVIGTRINNVVIRNWIPLSELFPPQPAPAPITYEAPGFYENTTSDPQEFTYGSSENFDSPEAGQAETPPAPEVPMPSEAPAAPESYVSSEMPQAPEASEPVEEPEKSGRSGKWILLILLLIALLLLGYLLWNRLIQDKTEPVEATPVPVESVQVRTDTIVVNDTLIIRDTVTVNVAVNSAVESPRVVPVHQAAVIEDEPAEPVSAPRFDPRAERALNSGIATSAPSQRDTELLDRCKRAINSSYNGANIVALRTEIAPFVENDSEFDQVDILLSRYKGGVDRFKQIITRINNDPAVKSFREKSRTGRPTGDDRRNFISAISNIVYRPGTKEYTSEIRDYIMAIPYLSGLMQPYLNSTAQNPTETSPIENQIMAM